MDALPAYWPVRRWPGPPAEWGLAGTGQEVMPRTGYIAHGQEYILGEAGPAGCTDQMHASFFRGMVTFSTVAAWAGGHQVFPDGFPFFAPRDNVVEGQGPAGMTAVLAGTVIAAEDVASA